MGTGYQRADVNNLIANGEVVDADVLDLEFNAVESAFNSTTGHTHDGTTAEGGPITKTGPTQDFTHNASWLEPKLTNTIDIGSTLKRFKTGWFQGAITAAGGFIGNLVGNVTGNVTGNATTATTLQTARNINGVAFNGSANISVNTNQVLTAGDGLTSTGTFNGGTARTISVDNSVVRTSGDQTVAGVKTFSSTIVGSINGNAGTVTNGVYTSRNVIAGNGLTGGGTLAADRTLTLGTPTTLTGATTNAVTTSSHTHAVTTSDSRTLNSATTILNAKAMFDHTNNGVTDHSDLTPTSRTLTAGTGITGGGSLAANRTFSIDFASQAEAEGGTDSAHVMSPLRVRQHSDLRYPLKSNNLSDLSSVSTARTNLGLGSMATASSGTGVDNFRTNSQNDARFLPSRFTSTEQSFSLGGLVTLTHGLGGVPDLIRGQLINRSGGVIDGWANGEGPEIALPDYGNTGYWWDLRRTSTQILVRVSPIALVVPNKSTGIVADRTASDWRLIITAIRWPV